MSRIHLDEPALSTAVRLGLRFFSNDLSDGKIGKEEAKKNDQLGETNKAIYNDVEFVPRNIEKLLVDFEHRLGSEQQKGSEDQQYS